MKHYIWLDVAAGYSSPQMMIQFTPLEWGIGAGIGTVKARSEEHTSELQSH